MDLEKDLNEMKIKMATESEHWHTIQALFGKDTANEEEKETEKANVNPVEEKVSTMEIGCNTEPVVTSPPVPAERKLSANNKSRRTSIEMVDKNLSPMQTPTKKGRSQVGTQTEDMEKNLDPKLSESPVKVVEEKSKSPEKGASTEAPAKEPITTCEVEIQTCTLPPISLESKIVQTLEIEEQKEIKETFNGTELEEALKKLQNTEER